MSRLFILVLSVSISARADIKKTESEYWKEISFGFEHFEKKISNSICHEDLKHFLGCVHGVNAVLSFAKPRLTLITNDRIATNPAVGERVADLGVAAVVTLKEVKTEKSLSLQIRRLKAERDGEFQALKKTFESAETPMDFPALLKLIREKVTYADTSEAEVTAAGLSAILRTVHDAHTSLIPLEYLKDIQASTGENFGGIGAVLQEIDGEILVQRPLEGSPALSAGVRAKDVITHVDKNSLQNKKLQEAVQLIRGPKGTRVTLTIRRKTQILDITIERGEIIRKNVTVKILPDSRKKLGYLRLEDFMEGEFDSELGKGIDSLTESQVQGLIFDLRGNGGGFLDKAVTVANLFLGKGVRVVSIKDLATQKEVKVFHTETDARTELPLLTLIDSESASASEIVSGALQDHQRGLLIGTRTFGKGSVQQIRPFSLFEFPGVGIKQTAQTFHLPSGRSNQILGVVPDLTVYRVPNPTEEDKFALREEDIFMNSLPPSSAPFEPLQPALTSKVQDCIGKTGIAAKRYQETIDEAIPPDYQLLFAQDAMGCMLE